MFKELWEYLIVRNRGGINMVEAITYESMIDDLSKKYLGQSKTFGILLVRPNRTAASEELLGDVQYFHHRSSNRLDIYMPGYGAYWGDEIPDAVDICKVGNQMWSYSAERFSDFIGDLERVSKWKYHSEIELLLLDFRENDISYKNVVRVNLNAALRDGAIDSATSFIENVICIFNKDKTAFDASDVLTLNELGKSISDALKEKIPFFNIFKRSRHYTVYSYSRE